MTVAPFFWAEVRWYLWEATTVDFHGWWRALVRVKVDLGFENHSTVIDCYD